MAEREVTREELVAAASDATARCAMQWTPLSPDGCVTLRVDTTRALIVAAERVLALGRSGYEALSAHAESDAIALDLDPNDWRKYRAAHIEGQQSAEERTLLKLGALALPAAEPAAAEPKRRYPSAHNRDTSQGSW